MGGTGRRVVTALNLAASGNVTGGGAEFMQAATVNYFQSLAVEQVKIIADELDSETARAALQGLVACGGAAAQGASCGSAAAGASASVVLNNLMDSVTGEKGEELDPDEKIARENLISTIVMGITAEAGGDVPMAIAAAQIEMENNQLATAIEIQEGMLAEEAMMAQQHQNEFMGELEGQLSENGLRLDRDGNEVVIGDESEEQSGTPTTGAPMPPDDDEYLKKDEVKKSSLKKVDNKYLEQKNVDAHAFKEDWLGTDINMSHWDIAVDKSTDVISLISKEGVIMDTDMTFNEMVDFYPK